MSQEQEDDSKLTIDEEGEEESERMKKRRITESEGEQEEADKATSDKVSVSGSEDLVVPSLHVQHECFGRARGVLQEELYTSPMARCIRCKECGESGKNT